MQGVRDGAVIGLFAIVVFVLPFHNRRVTALEDRFANHYTNSTVTLGRWLWLDPWGKDQLTDDEVHWALTNVILPRRGGIWAQPLFRNLSGETLPITATNK